MSTTTDKVVVVVRPEPGVWEHRRLMASGFGFPMLSTAKIAKGLVQFWNRPCRQPPP
jgi:hypothetical protein